MKLLKVLFGGLIFAAYSTICIAVPNDSVQTDTNNVKVIKKSVVIKEKTLEKRINNQNRAVIGDYIEVTVANISYLIDSIAEGNKDSLILFLNNIQLEDIHPESFNIDSKADTGIIVFDLNRKSASVKKLFPYFITMLDAPKMTLSIGIKDKSPSVSKVDIVLRYTGKAFLYITIGLFVLLVVVIFFVSKKFHIIRSGNSLKSPYSLARCQLAFWTILVSFSFLYLWIINGEMPELPSSVLMLLGISISTKACALYIDYSNKQVNNKKATSKGFLRDILSDENGVNIQRSQMFLWTLILGFIYMHSVIVDQLIIGFDTNLLALMGISSGTYVLLKTIEKRESPEPVKKTSKSAKDSN